MVEALAVLGGFLLLAGFLRASGLVELNVQLRFKGNEKPPKQLKH